MGGTTIDDYESPSLLPLLPKPPQEEDSYHLAYIFYFILGLGYLVPWNAFITAVDYFSYLYPDASVDRVFAVVYMVVGLVCLLFIVFFSHKSNAFVRINVGLGLFVVALLVIPVMDATYIKGQVGVYGGFYVSVAAVALSGIADPLVQGGIIGTAAELPQRYMQATLAGTAASGVLISALRILTKAVYSQDAIGLRKSANLYFIVSIVVMMICIFIHNVAHRLPVIKHYNNLKRQAVSDEKEEKGVVSDDDDDGLWQYTLGDVFGSVKWYGFGIVLLYGVTFAISPGFITQDVRSEILGDWYPIILLTSSNVFDLVGKSLSSVYVVEDIKEAIGASFARLLFFPAFLACLHGPLFLRTEIPVITATCLLGLTNGYLTSCLMMVAPKTVPLQHSETAGIVLVLFLGLGTVTGAVVSWFWVI